MSFQHNLQSMGLGRAPKEYIRHARFYILQGIVASKKKKIPTLID